LITESYLFIYPTPTPTKTPTQTITTTPTPTLTTTPTTTPTVTPTESGFRNYLVAKLCDGTQGVMTLPRSFVADDVVSSVENDCYYVVSTSTTAQTVEWSGLEYQDAQECLLTDGNNQCNNFNCITFNLSQIDLNSASGNTISFRNGRVFIEYFDSSGAPISSSLTVSGLSYYCGTSLQSKFLPRAYYYKDNLVLKYNAANSIWTILDTSCAGEGDCVPNPTPTPTTTPTPTPSPTGGVIPNNLIFINNSEDYLINEYGNPIIF